MSRRYDDMIDVRRRNDAPAEFLWRGRLYVIREVVSHWVETGAWWRDPSRAGTQGSAALALDAAEREVWRVEATPGWIHGVGIYDVVFDWACGSWTLRRVLD